MLLKARSTGQHGDMQAAAPRQANFPSSPAVIRNPKNAFTIYLNTFLYISVSMGTQISLKLSERIYSSAKAYSEIHGYDSLQDFIRELIRERLFEGETEVFGGFSSYLASEESLARNWLLPEEDEAWSHLQREI